MNGFARKIVVCFLLCAALWLSGLLWFVAQIPTAPNPDPRPADAIVVLTGGSGRIEYGLQLLSEGKGKKLFISGVHENISVDSLIKLASPAMREHLPKNAATFITLGHDAWNTIGNAEETQRWLGAGDHTIRLITANYHMPRALQEFQTALPKVTIIPSPSFPEDFNLGNWWREPDSRRLVLLEYHKFIASKLRHWFLSAI